MVDEVGKPSIGPQWLMSGQAKHWTSVVDEVGKSSIGPQWLMRGASQALDLSG